MEYKVDDQETLAMVKEDNNDAKDALFQKYSYIIDIVIKKYTRMAYLLKVDYKDLYQEGMLGFTDAINTYQDDKEAGLPRFITVCVERKLQNAIKKASTLKSKMMTDSLSLEHSYNDLSAPLIDIISDNNQNNPLINLANQESYDELVEKIKDILSDQEYEVYSLLVSGINYIDIATLLEKNPKQIDNSIQRIRGKIKKMLDK